MATSVNHTIVAEICLWKASVQSSRKAVRGKELLKYRQQLFPNVHFFLFLLSVLTKLSFTFLFAR